MGIFSGPVTARRYRVLGNPPDDWRRVFLDRVEAYVARSPALDQTAEIQTMGFALPENLLDLDFTETERWISDNYIFLTFRVDKLEMPKRKIKARLAQRVRDWCREQGVERAPNAVKRQLKEAVEHELRGENRIKMQAIDVAWNVTDGLLYFGSLAESLNETFRKFFFRCFGHKAFAIELPGRFVVHAAEVETKAVYPATDLMAWLFFVSTSLEGKVEPMKRESGDEANLRIWTGDRIVFSDPIKSAKVTVKADNASEKPESRKAIAERRVIDELELTIEKGGDAIGNLAFKGALPDVLKVRSSIANEGSDADRRVTTLLFYEGLMVEVGQLVEHFLETREDPVAWSKLQTQLIAWAKADVASGASDENEEGS